VTRERVTYDRTAKAVTDRSDKSECLTAGPETADPLAFLARGLVHIPDKGHVTTRSYGWYANRPRGMRGTADPVAAGAPPMLVTHWRTSDQKLRWCASALWATERQFRRVKNHRYLRLLMQALQGNVSQTTSAAA